MGIFCLWIVSHFYKMIALGQMPEYALFYIL